jgi:hypothetical protein
MRFACGRLCLYTSCTKVQFPVQRLFGAGRGAQGAAVCLQQAASLLAMQFACSSSLFYCVYVPVLLEIGCGLFCGRCGGLRLVVTVCDKVSMHQE